MKTNKYAVLSKSALHSLRKYFPNADIYTELAHRLLYAHDASAYRIIPLGIVFPRTTTDIQFLYSWAHEYHIPLTFRSAGTSLSGQAIGQGLIVDCSKYWKDISYDSAHQIVSVEPGIIGGHVNRHLISHHRKIGPDPASINACMMGGILSNNASGMCCGIEQNSYHTIASIKCILPNGFIVDTTDTNSSQDLQINAPEIHDEILRIRNEIIQSPILIEHIRKKYRLKNTVGYCLNAFLDETEPVHILKKLFIGSEGTLGFIAKAGLHTIPTLPHASTAILFFNTIDDACKAIPLLVKTSPAAMEIMDRAALRSIESQEGAPDIIQSLGEDGTGILIEYQSDTHESLLKMLMEFSDIQGNLHLIENPIFTDDITLRNQYWKIRKGMFPSVGASRAKGTGIINEDIAVPIESLADAVKDLRLLFAKYHFHEAIIFGHAKEGNLHFVIAHAFDSEQDIKAFGDFMQDLANVIIDKYQGSLKAEHGTGRNIAPFVSHEWGNEAYALMKRIKQLFDPHGIMNPGVIISDDPTCHVKHVKPFPIVHDIIDSCIECGYCESHCPTHHYTLSPRQRIILDREIALEHDPIIRKELSDFAIYAQIDSCATDGLCSLACPVQINTGQYMLEKRSMLLDIDSKNRYDKEAHSIQERDKSIRRKMKAGHITSRIIGDNVLQKISVIGSSLFDTPQWISGLPTSWKQNNLENNNTSKIIYLPSCTARLFAKPNVDSLALPDLILSLSQRAGLNLSIPNDIANRCCGLAYSSKGSESSADIAFHNWSDQIPKDSIVLTDSYSCYSHIRESMHLIDLLSFAEMLIDTLPIQKLDGMAILHPPCSMQMSKATERMKAITSTLATQVFIPESLGCCGMAGDHGFKDPGLSKHACADMKKEVIQQKNVIGYYSLNPTCELGMKIGTGKEYVSLFYLIQKALKS